MQLIYDRKQLYFWLLRWKIEESEKKVSRRANFDNDDDDAIKTN